MEFYNTLRESMSNNTKAPATPEDADALISAIDDSHEAGKEKESLVVGTYVLASLYRSSLISARAQNLKSQVKTQTKAIRESGSITTPLALDKRPKVERSACVPVSFLSSTSMQLKLALALFMSNKLADSMKKDFVLAIIGDSDTGKACMYISDMFADQHRSVANVRAYIDSRVRQPLTKNVEKFMLCALIELSELLHDKMYCKLALDMNSMRYRKLSMTYLESKLIHSISPFEPAIASYIQNSIARCSQDDERKTIYNQYHTSPIETMSAIMSCMPDPTKKADKAREFNPETMYQCHKGPSGYTRDIVGTFFKTDNKVYKILTYSDCLYDVTGCTTTNVDLTTGQEMHTDTLFNEMPWAERLKLLPTFRAKVVVTVLSGAELNAYIGESCDITVAWFNDDARSCMKTYSMKKPRELKLKSEDSE